MIAMSGRTAILAPLMLVAAAGIARAQTPAEEVDWPAYGGAPEAPDYSALSDLNACRRQRTGARLAPTPTHLETTPPRMTKTTRRTAVRSLSGSPSRAMMSASNPGASFPS